MEWISSHISMFDFWYAIVVVLSTSVWYFLGRTIGYRKGMVNGVKLSWQVIGTTIKPDLSGQARDFLSLCKDVSIANGPSPAQMIELIKLGNGMIDDARLFLEKKTGLSLSDSKKVIEAIQGGADSMKSCDDPGAPQVVKDINKAMKDFMKKANAENMSPDDIASGLMNCIEGVGGDGVDVVIRVKGKKDKDDFNGPLTEV